MSIPKYFDFTLFYSVGIGYNNPKEFHNAK